MGKIIEILFIVTLVILGFIYFSSFYFKKRFSEMNISGCKLSGFEVVKLITEKMNIEDVYIIKKAGINSNYYKDKRKTVVLSPEVFDGVNDYALVIALGVGFSASNKYDYVIRRKKIVYFLVMLAYINIILGGFLENFSIIYLGLSLFIIAFLLMLYVANGFMKLEKELLEFLEKEKIVKDVNEDLKYTFAIYSLSEFNRLTFGLIDFFI